MALDNYQELIDKQKQQSNDEFRRRFNVKEVAPDGTVDPGQNNVESAEAVMLAIKYAQDIRMGLSVGVDRVVCPVCNGETLDNLRRILSKDELAKTDFPNATFAQ